MSVEVYPVIHIQDAVQAQEQAAMAYECDADGIYLIDHLSGLGDTTKLIEAYKAVATAHPDSFIGLNFLQYTSSYVSFRFIDDLVTHDEIPRLPNGLWVDDASIAAERTDELRQEHPVLKDVRYLGGVAFKYTQLYTDNPATAAWHACRLSDYVDTVTTSGTGTGYASSLEKVAAIKEAIGDQPLALASGVNAGNIASFAEHVDEVLVSTSVETSPQSGIFDESKLRELIMTAHNY